VWKKSSIRKYDGIVRGKTKRGTSERLQGGLIGTQSRLHTTAVQESNWGGQYDGGKESARAVKQNVSA